MNILIATSRFQDIAGSEITVFEYAQEFKRKGLQPSIAAFLISDNYIESCHAEGIKVYNLSDPSINNPEKPWDIIWVFHWPTYYFLFGKSSFNYKRIIFSSLSHYEPLEAPPIELDRIDLFTTQSFENKENFLDNYPNYSERVIVLPNSIPREFWGLSEEKSNNSKKIIIVSNHIPEEILELIPKLEKNGWLVDIFGIGFQHRKIQPRDISGYAACITIGKTVQYCLALQIPVFCYDRFGGPGWIKKTNFTEAGKYNFSGRCTNKKMSSELLIEKFNDSFIPKIQELKELKELAFKEYSLFHNLDNALNCIEKIPKVFLRADTTNKNILSKNLDVFTRSEARQVEYFNAWKSETTRRELVEQQLIEIEVKQAEYYNAWKVETTKRELAEQEIIVIEAKQAEYYNAWKAETTKRKMLEQQLKAAKDSYHYLESEFQKTLKAESKNREQFKFEKLIIEKKLNQKISKLKSYRTLSKAERMRFKRNFIYRIYSLSKKIFKKLNKLISRSNHD